MKTEAEQASGFSPAPRRLTKVPALHILPNAIQFAVRVQPGARREGIVGLYGEAVKIALNAPAVDGKANDALLRLLATLFGTPRSAVEIVSGQFSRSKVVRITGVTEVDARRIFSFGN